MLSGQDLQGWISMVGTWLEMLPHWVVDIFSGLKIYVIPLIVVIFVVSIALLIVGIFRIRGDVKSLVKKLRKLPKHAAVVRSSDWSDIEKELEQDKVLHNQWQEFLECVVTEQKKQYKNGEKHSYNTVAARNFFHFDEVVSTSNVWLLNIKFNFFTAVPSILTGLGIIGTFIGIVASLRHDPNIAGIAGINIEAFLSGLWLSFATSIVGLLLAVLFTLLEKVMIDRAEHLFDELIREIDRVFKRKAEQQYLANINSKLDEQSHVMKTMAAEIGDKVVSGVAKLDVLQLSEGIKQGIDVGLHDFVDNLHKFNDSQKSQQESFQKILEQSKLLSSNMEKWNNSLSSRCVELDRASEKFSQAVDSIGETGENVLEAAQKCSDNVENALEVANNFRQEIKGFFEGISDLNSKIQNALTNTHRELDAHLSKAIAKIGGGIEGFKDAAEKVEKLLSQVDTKIDSLDEKTVVKKASEMLQELQETGREMHGDVDKIKKIILQYSQRQGNDG